MLKKIILVLLVSVLMTGCFRSIPVHQTENGSEAGDIKETELKNEEAIPPVSYDELYSDVLDEFYSVITEQKESSLDGTMGVAEVIIHMEPSQALESVGYKIMDISGDGIPELIIGSIAPEGQIVNGTMIYAVYTIAEGKPQLVVEGHTRNSYRPMKNGEFFYQGSSGAMYSFFGTYGITENGTELTCHDYYFTHELDDDKTTIGVFYNTTGEWNPAVSEQLNITLDELWSIQAEYMEAVQVWELEPFKMYVSMAQKG